MISRISQAASPALVIHFSPVRPVVCDARIEPCMLSLYRWLQKGRASARGFCPCLCTTADTRQNRASLHDIRTDLEERFNLSPLLLEAPLGGTLDRGRGASGSDAARPPKRCVWVSWAEQARALDEAERNSSGDDDGGDLRAR